MSHVSTNSYATDFWLDKTETLIIDRKNYVENCS